jgi:hypothetical protein
MHIANTNYHVRFVVELKKAKAEEAARTTQGSVEPKSEQEKKDE